MKRQKDEHTALMDSLDAYIEFADARTDHIRKTFSDAEFYRRIKAYIEKLRAPLLAAQDGDQIAQMCREAGYSGHRHAPSTKCTAAVIGIIFNARADQ